MKKLLVLFLALAMLFSLATLFVGCEDNSKKKSSSSQNDDEDEEESKEDDEENDDSEGNQDKDSPETEKLNGKLTVATVHNPPYVYWDHNEPTGISIEIAKVLAEKLNLEPEFVKCRFFDDMLKNVKDGNADVIFDIVYNEQYLEILDYSIEYMEDRQVFVVPKYSQIDGLDSLKQGDYVIAVKEDSTAQTYLMLDPVARFIFRSDYNSVLGAVASMSADCAVVDYAAAIKYADTWDLEILEEDYLKMCFSVGVSKDNPELRQAIDLALTEMINDGTIDSIIEKYMD